MNKVEFIGKIIESKSLQFDYYKNLEAKIDMKLEVIDDRDNNIFKYGKRHRYKKVELLIVDLEFSGEMLQLLLNRYKVSYLLNKVIYVCGSITSDTLVLVDGFICI